MFYVIKALYFSYAHRLLNYPGKCKALHGHNGKAEIILSSKELDQHGMVKDFNEIKGCIGSWIEEELDHKTFLNKDDPLAVVLQNAGETIYPMSVNPTAENIAKIIYDYAQKEGFPVTEVRLWETDTSCATYSTDLSKENP